MGSAANPMTPSSPAPRRRHPKSGSPTPTPLETAVNSMSADELDRALTAHALFFDILSEEDVAVRDEKLKQAQTNLRRVTDTHHSMSTASQDGCTDLRHRSGSVSSGTQYDGSVSAGHFGGAGSYRDISFDAAMEAGIQEGVEAPLTASQLLRELCADMYVSPLELEDMVEVGEGAFAVVHRCVLRRDVSASFSGSRSKGAARGRQLVAVKQLKPAVLENEIELHGFIAETSVLRQLRHPKIVEFKGVGAFHMESHTAMRRSMFLVQEYMSGGTLKDLVVEAYFDAHPQRLYMRQDALRWALDIAEALEYLHGFRPLIVHRDLKLENILLTSGQPARASAKLADFGLHKMIKDVASGVPLAETNDQVVQALAVATGVSTVPPSPGATSIASSADARVSPPGAPDAALTAAAAAGKGGLRVRTSANGLPPVAPTLTPRVSVTPGATPAAAGAAAFADQISPLPSPGHSWHAALASGPIFAPAAATAANTGGPFAAARAADPLLTFSGRGGSGGPMTPASPSGVALDVSAGDGPPAVAKMSAIGRSSSGPITSTAERPGDSGHAHSESGPYGSKALALSALRRHTISPAGVVGMGMGVAERLRHIRAAGRDMAADPPPPPPAAAMAPAQLGLKRVASAVGHPHQRRNSGAGKQGSSGSRSHTPSGSMTERRAVPAGGVGGVGNSGLNTPDTSAMRRSLAVGEAGGSPKKKMLRRVSIAEEVQTAPVSGDDPDADRVYEMTGQTGSLCYMAPEVLLGCFYNQKVDVFSFGVVLWELLMYKPTIAAIPFQGEGYDREAVFHYAEQVAAGFRQPFPPHWPQKIRALIADCWHQNPALRPSFSVVVTRLRAMQTSGLAKQWDITERQNMPLNGPWCACCGGSAVK